MDLRQREKILFEQKDFPVCAGCFHGKASISSRPLYHSEIEFQLICQGRGHYYINGRNYQFQKNSVLIIHENEIHNYLAHPASSIIRYNLIFSPRIFENGSAVQNILRRIKEVRYLALEDKETTMAEILLREIRNEYSLQTVYWKELIRNNIEKLLIILAKADERGAPNTIVDNRQIQGIINYVEEHFSERLLLAEVARMFGFSVSFLSREFKSYVGMGFKEYLIRRRLLEAKRLLEESDLKVAVVALNAGFEDLSTFNHDFKKLIGLSPSAYRKILL